MSPGIGDDDTDPRYAQRLGQDLCVLLFGEVMKQMRRGDHIDRRASEGEPEHVAGDSPDPRRVRALPAQDKMLNLEVQSDPRSLTFDGSQKIRASGPEIEKREPARGSDEAADEKAVGAVASGKTIEALEVPQRPLAIVERDIIPVEPLLGFNAAHDAL